MSREPDSKSALQCRSDAQKIAFGPVVFHAARLLRDMGILAFLARNRHEGSARDDIMRETGLSEYAVRVLLESGMVSDLVYEKDGRFFMTKTGHFVLNDPMTRVNMDFVNDVCYHGIARLEQALREQRPAGLEVFGDWPTIYEGLPELPDAAQRSWYAFDHYYSDASFAQCLPIMFESRPAKLLDVGGNTGRWALMCLNHSPKVHVTIMDLPKQVSRALANIREQGFGDRAGGHPANLLDHAQAFPAGYDVIWMSQLLDCFGEEDIVGILTRARAAMSDQARLYILETFWDRQRYDAATYCVVNTSLYFTCMANGNSRMYHSADMIRCVEQAGLIVDAGIDDLGIGHTLLVCRTS
ncbi:MAG: methyltransferase [Chitinivibrionales bacterium]|nr:methyltransferase [Chitinivibrionales bacterium]MBD3394731.1 methyltransferase [Chitinivibrionales bacterium]